MKKILTIIAAVLISSSIFAQRPQGPQIPEMYGISKMTFRVSSPEVAEEFYGDYLGFDHAFDYESIYGPVLVYKINDRQFLEFLVVDQNVAELGNYISMTIQTPDVEAMHKHIKSNGYEVTDIVVDGAGNKVFTTVDDYGKLIEFADMNSSTLHAKSEGKFLSERRISTQMLHSGLHRNESDEFPKFWREVLGFKEFIRFPEDRDQHFNLLYLYMPGSTEVVEATYTVGAAPEANWEHPCLSTYDMQETTDILRERDPSIRVNPHVGRTKRFLISVKNVDGTKVEFSEPFSTR
ncbi:MAG: VOC family protein [Rikenellaceae bacterium]